MELSQSKKKWGVKFTPQEIPPYIIWKDSAEDALQCQKIAKMRAGTMRFDSEIVEG